MRRKTPTKDFHLYLPKDAASLIQQIAKLEKRSPTKQLTVWVWQGLKRYTSQGK